MDADCFVLLSKSEALGLVFWEAMYMNVPVIGRPVGGIVETIGKDGERGFLWDAKDGTEAFKNKLERAIRKDPDVQAMTVRAREYVQRKIATI
jgi:glycosyltransferase involved in cell wall biosynthesis